MQGEAKSKGWLSVYNQFSWWYPWYRMHFKITVGATTIDAGVSMLPGGSTQSSEGVDIFSQLNDEFVLTFVTNAVTMMGEYAAAKWGFWTGQYYVVLIMLGLEFGIDSIALGRCWNNMGELLAFIIVNVIMGFIATQGGFARNFLNLLTGVNTATMVALISITTGMEAAGGPPMLSPVDLGQVGLSLAFASLALARWAGLMTG
jgi:hypothetical protein